VIRLPDGRLHLISAITPQKSAGTVTSAPVSQTLPSSASTAQSTSAARTLLIGGQRFLLSSTPGAQVLVTPGSVTGQKIITGLSGTAGLSRPQLLLASPGQSTMIRMPSSQHVVLRSSQPGAVPTTPQSSAASSLNPAHGLFSAAAKSPPSTPYAVTPEVVQQGNRYSLLAVYCLLDHFPLSFCY